MRLPIVKLSLLFIVTGMPSFDALAMFRGVRTLTRQQSGSRVPLARNLNVQAQRRASSQSRGRNIAFLGLMTGLELSALLHYLADEDAKNEITYSTDEVKLILGQADDSPCRKKASPDGTPKQLYEEFLTSPLKIPLRYFPEKMLCLIEKDQLFQREVLKACLANDFKVSKEFLVNDDQADFISEVTEVSESCTARWQKILSEYSLDELYTLKSAGKKEKILRAILPELFDEYNKLQDLWQQAIEEAEREQLIWKNWENDECNKKYHAIAQKHGIEIPKWVQIKEGRIPCSNLSEIYVDPKYKETVIAGILGHELGHIMANDGLLNLVVEGISDPRKRNLGWEKEYAADCYVCMASDHACRGLAGMLMYPNNYWTHENKDSFTHPSHQRRIKKIREILAAKKRYDEGYCWNPLHKHVGGPKWYRCKGQENRGSKE